MSCELAHNDGSYVLGALSPQERQEFERHLPDCPECSRAVRELAGLPGLLGRVDERVLEEPPAGEPVPDTLLPSLVREVRRTRRRRVFTAAGLAAAAVTAVVGSLAATGALPSGDTPSAGNAPSVSVPAGRPMTRVGNAPVHATLAFANTAWGTRLDLVCRYDSSWAGAVRGPTYVLVVHTRDGRTQQVATWRMTPGRTMRLSGATAAARKDIASVQVRTTDGQPVLKLTT